MESRQEGQAHLHRFLLPHRHRRAMSFGSVSFSSTSFGMNGHGPGHLAAALRILGLFLADTPHATGCLGFSVLGKFGELGMQQTKGVRSGWPFVILCFLLPGKGLGTV